MTTLTEKDYRDLLGTLYSVNCCEDAESFLNVLMPSLVQLFKCECVTFHLVKGYPWHIKIVESRAFKADEHDLSEDKVFPALYTPEESQTKLAELRKAIARAKVEIGRLNTQMADRSLSTFEVEKLRQDLKELRDQNLERATFQERADLIAKLGIKGLPSEDMKCRKIFCQLDLKKVNDEREQTSIAKVTFGGAEGSRTRLSKRELHSKSSIY